MTQFYTGVVEDRTSDPLKLGRCKVRIFGLHSESKQDLPTQDLPWAIVMQPVTSAAMNGIGFSPLGPVEGSWVVVIFTDPDKQQPVIIGTLGGVPQKKNQSTSVAGQQTGASEQTAQETVPNPDIPELSSEPEQIVKKVTSLSLSEEGLKELKSHEGLASLDKAGRRIGRDSIPATTKIYPYKDTSGIWTIGWGSTYLENGEAVNEDTVLTKEAADSLLALKLKKEFEAGVKRNTRVPVTQSMFDALVSLAYNMGISGLFRSSIGTSLNAGKYEEAAAFIPETKTNNGVLLSRRKKEQKLFLKDGVPTLEGEVNPSLLNEETNKAVPDKTKNPAVIKSATIPEFALVNLNPINNDGFEDPSKVYPKWTNEPDTHRLARNESVDKTIVFSKEAARVTGVKTASGSTWDQPRVPFNAKYPYNHVFATESGHVEEWDDTTGSERRHSYHKSGTFYEIDANGTRVTRIVGDDYEILERNGNVLIRGNCNVTINGDSNVRVQNNSNIEVLGDAALRVTGNLTQAVGGDLNIKVGGQLAIDASKIYMNTGKAVATLPTESATGEVSVPPLTVPSRKSQIESNYETPEEGDKAEFNEAQVKSGTVEEEETQKATEEKVEETEVTTKPASPILAVCGEDVINAKQFTSGFNLTENFTLGQICTGSSGIPSGVNYGLTANEIVCNLRLLTKNCIEPIKKMYPNIKITSAWRSEEHNKKIGGSKTSDHLFGRAVDFQLSGFNRKQHYEAVIAIQKALPAFKQLILEYKRDTTWIHVSFDINNNKMQALTIDAAVNKTLKSGGYVLIL